MSRYEKRKKYINSYAQDALGNWHYIGQWYVPQDLETKYESYRKAFLCQILLTALLTVAMGFLPAGPMLRIHGQWVNYVMLCYGLQFIFAVAAVRYAALILNDKMRLTEYDIRYVTRIPGFTAACGACAAATAIAQLVYTIVSGFPEQLVWDIALAALAAAVSGTNFLFFRFLQKVPWQIRENH